MKGSIKKTSDLAAGDQVNAPVLKGICSKAQTKLLRDNPRLRCDIPFGRGRFYPRKSFH